MSFKFNFAAADDSDPDSDPDNGPENATSSAASPPTPAPVCSHSLTDLLDTLPSNISYSTLTISESLALHRRELYDVRMQLMAADTLTDTSEAVALGNEDVRGGVYEGGLKSWECSVDLALYLHEESTQARKTLELGCGTALPSLFLFRRLLEKGHGELTLADYNASVLKLVTLPNLFLTYAAWADPELPSQGDLEVTPELVSSFTAALKQKGIFVSFVSGCWGKEMLDALPSKPYDLVLGSETIYAPGTTPLFVDVMKGALGDDGKALVTAKKIYFGVGGSVEDFVANVKKEGRWKTQVMRELGEKGVGRVVIEVRR